jgi:hypothetical protein
VGYLCATVAPALLDPLLKSHVRFPGGRTYPRAWMIVPISLLVLLLTFLVAKYVPRGLRAIAVGVPLLLASACSNLLIFRRELPHGTLVDVTAVWLAIVGLWTWIHDSYAGLSDCFSEGIDRGAALEYLREKAGFYRTLAFGLVAGALALLVGAFVNSHSLYKEMLSDPREIFLMDRYNTTYIAIYMLLLFFGPIFESLKAWSRMGDLFLTLKVK